MSRWTDRTGIGGKNAETGLKVAARRTVRPARGRLRLDAAKPAKHAVGIGVVKVGKDGQGFPPRPLGGGPMPHKALHITQPGQRRGELGWEVV